jgi:hypothetical protein
VLVGSAQRGKELDGGEVERGELSLCNGLGGSIEGADLMAGSREAASGPRIPRPDLGGGARRSSSPGTTSSSSAGAGSSLTTRSFSPGSVAGASSSSRRSGASPPPLSRLRLL